MCGPCLTQIDKGRDKHAATAVASASHSSRHLLGRALQLVTICSQQLSADSVQDSIWKLEQLSAGWMPLKAMSWAQVTCCVPFLN